DDLTVSGNGGEGISADTDSVIRNCRVYGNGGFEGVFSHGGQITDCVARGNAGFGIFGYNCIIRNCHCENNTGGGIDCNAGSVLDSSAINNTSYGIRLYGGGSARRCHVQGNGSAGIYTLNNSPVLGGVIADCTVATNNNYGISLVGFGYLVTGNQVAYNLSAGIAVQSSNNRIDGNQILVAASAYGIQISSLNYTNNVIVRNSVYGSGNSANNYNITGTGNDVGPIGNASTNTSPWANFSH
ncbi:MAG: right-handed parallel beta-helix repeat-containing protein, partial [Limisphaerales bacterium]